MNGYQFRSITMEHVREIEQWRYEGYMKEIYMKPYHDNYDSVTNTTRGPDDCDGYAVYLDDTLFGLFEYYPSREKLEIGLAINPAFVGQGHSTAFIEAGIAYAKATYDQTYNTVWLNVEKENTSAYYAYLKAGFVTDKEKGSEYTMKKTIR